MKKVYTTELRDWDIQYPMRLGPLGKVSMLY